jgi:Lrp/AsnC family transcriptional regulator of ectoine degradation
MRFPTVTAHTAMRDSPGKKFKADKLDLRIIKALSQRGRITISELSKEVGLSPTPCSARVEKLEAEGVISGYQADVNVERLAALSLYYVTISLKNWTPAAAKKLEALLLANPYVLSCDHLFGSLDYVIRMYARSTQHYHDLMDPLEVFEIDYTTYPVSRQILRPQLHRLIAEISRDPL